MTRKRFKKLLMSYGYSHDDAEWLTDFAKNSGMSYADFYYTRRHVFAKFFRITRRRMHKIWSEFKKGY